MKQLSDLRENRDQLIVFMDTNKHIYDKVIGKNLIKADGLGMKEAISSFTGKKLGVTFFRGTKPIDRVWYTLNVIVTGSCVIPSRYGVGDHRLFVIDFLSSSLVILDPPRIIRSQAQRLKMKIPRAAEKYLDKFEKKTSSNTV